jgi:hypothetical protein
MRLCDNFWFVKIHADKIESGPPHALSVRDVRLIIETVPLDWTKEIKEIRISNSLEWHSFTFFSRFDGCLTIVSRNRTKRRVLAAALSERAAISIGSDQGLRYRSKAMRSQLSKMTAALQKQLIPLVASPTDLKSHISLAGFKEMHFPLVPNDSETQIRPDES